MDKRIGEWSFLIGFVVAIVFGLLTKWVEAGTLTLILILLGLAVGFLNISEKEATPFLVAALALLATGTTESTITEIPKVGAYLASVVSNIAVFIAPAAIVVAIKSIHSLAKD